MGTALLGCWVPKNMNGKSLTVGNLKGEWLRGIHWAHRQLGQRRSDSNKSPEEQMMEWEWELQPPAIQAGS
ncbi:Nebulin [Manis pentadactyla]|nr:Nebulin [Manis pentadactyla]